MFTNDAGASPAAWGERLRALALAALALAVIAPAALANGFPERLDGAGNGHGGPIKAITLDKAGRHALTSSFDYAIIQWALDGEGGTVLNRLIGHDAAVNDALYLPAIEGAPRRIVSGSDDGTVILWDLESGEILHRFAASGEKIIDIAITSDGRYAASAGWDRTARIWNLETLEPHAVLSGHRDNVNVVGFDEDNARIFTGAADGTIRMWDLETGAYLRTIYEHGWSVNTLALLPGGVHLVFGATDGSAGLLHIESG